MAFGALSWMIFIYFSGISVFFVVVFFFLILKQMQLLNFVIFLYNSQNFLFLISS